MMVSHHPCSLSLGAHLRAKNRDLLCWDSFWLWTTSPNYLSRDRVGECPATKIQGQGGDSYWSEITEETTTGTTDLEASSGTTWLQLRSRYCLTHYPEVSCDLGKELWGAKMSLWPVFWVSPFCSPTRGFRGLCDLQKNRNSQPLIFFRLYSYNWYIDVKLITCFRYIYWVLIMHKALWESCWNSG